MERHGYVNLEGKTDKLQKVETENVRNVNIQGQNMTIESQNVKIQTQNVKIQTQNVKIQTQNVKIQNPKRPRTEVDTETDQNNSKMGPKTLNIELKIPKLEPKTLKTNLQTPKTDPKTPKTDPKTPKTDPNTPRTDPNTPKKEQETTHSNSPDEDNDLFYFESDHLALRGNKEYSEVLKTIVILESIRERALKDYETIAKLHKQVLDDPMPFIDKMRTNQPLGIPEMCQIPDVPKIDWKKFNVPIPAKSLKEIADDDTFLSPEKREDERERNARREDLQSRHGSKSHFQPWTTEEQKRLEELLVEFPPEDVELRRFRKIAAALGNRTAKQVCSRVQKFFQKLMKAGLPIPGRIPKTLYDKKKIHKHQRHNHYLWRPSTFFPQLDIPVVMNDDENAPGPSQSSMGSSDSLSATHSQQNYLLSNNYHETNTVITGKTDVELQLDLLKRVRYEKEKCEDTQEPPFQHLGYKCDYCQEEPILGSRWHCSSCSNDSIDFCTDCVVSQLYSTNGHALNHKFLVVRNDKSGSLSNYSDWEEDSMSDSGTRDNDNEYNSDMDASFQGVDERLMYVSSSKDT